MKQYIDISWPITNDASSYKNRHVVHIEPTKTFTRDGARESRIALDSHTGTHIDAPAHFLKDGITVDQLCFDKLIGPCRVLDLTMVSEKIMAKDLNAHEPCNGEILLLKTTNSSHTPIAPFDPNFVYLSAEAADYLVSKKIKTVGIDYLGIERNQPEHQTHRSLLSAGIVIIEGLRLQHVAAGAYELICLPLLLSGLDASPARAVLEQEKGL
ncbi:MAG: cyclase family protein [Candidatus Babeliales bacterium]|jgi:arylformamidase